MQPGSVKENHLHLHSRPILRSNVCIVQELDRFLQAQTLRCSHANTVMVLFGFPTKVVILEIAKNSKKYMLVEPNN